MASSKINIDLVLNAKGFRPLGKINGQLGEFEKSLDASNARVLAFGASAGAILAVRKALTATVKAAIEVEKSLKDINVILQATSVNLKKFGSDLFEIASQTGQSFQVAAQAAAELARQGLGTEETLKRTRDALILARLSGMGAAEAVNSLTAAINTFNKVGLDSTVIINKLANVDAAFAVSSDDLAKALGRVGSSAKGAGVSLDQLLAIVTTVQQKTARGGAVIGNSFKTIFTRIQRPRVIKELENLGVAVKDVQGDILPAIKVLNNLAKQFDNLSQSQRSQISELVGGVFQVNILKAAMSDLSKETSIYNRALGISLGSSDQAIKRNEELNKTLSAQFQRTVNTFKEGAAELGQLTFGPALERLFGIVEGFEKLGETDGGKIGGAIAKSIFEGIGNFISGPGLLIIGFTLFKTFSQLGKFAADAFKTLTGLNKNFQTQLNLQKQIFNVLEENPDLLNKIKSGAISVEDAHKEIYNQISKNTNALEEQLQMSQRLAQGLAGAGAGFSSEFGAFTGGRPPKFGGSGKSSGYAPNFAEEVAGMLASGYSNSQVRNPKVRRQQVHDGMGGSFTTTVNGHEDIVNTKNSSGKKATFVVPPRNSGAYKNYMSALHSGFIPNFTGDTLISKEELEELRILTDPKNKVEGAYPAGSKKRMQAIVRKGFPKNKSLPNQGPQKMYEIAKGKYDTQMATKTARDSGDVTGYGKAVDFKDRKGAGVQIYDIKNEAGLLGLYGQGSEKGYVESATKDITEFSELIKSVKDEKAKKALKKALPSRIGFKNVQFKSLTKELKEQKGQSQKGEFSQMVRKNLAEGVEDLTNDFSKWALGNDAIKSANVSKSGNPLFSVSAEGNIFETAINALTAQGKGSRADSFEAALGSDQQQVWDFEESGNASSRFVNLFNFDDKIKKADAKRTLSKNAGASMVNKIFNPKGGDMWKGKSWVTDLKRAQESVNTAAGGFVPNFNSLYESIRREKEAGVPAGRIRVGQSERLRNGSNPAGLGIYNTRDEPMGLNQGISNALAAGIDPKKKGMFSGFVPNFTFMRDGKYNGPGTGGNNMPVKVTPTLDLSKIERGLVHVFIRAFTEGERAFSDAFFARFKQTKQANAYTMGGRDDPNRKRLGHTENFGNNQDFVGGGTRGGRKGTPPPKEEKKGGSHSAMSGLLMLGLVEQAVTGLKNTVDENNTVFHSVVKTLGGLIATAVALNYGIKELKNAIKESAPSGEGEKGGRLHRLNEWQKNKRTQWEGRFNRSADRFRTRGMRSKSRLGRFANRGMGTGMRGMGKIVGPGSGVAGGAMAGAAVTYGAAKLVGGIYSESDMDKTFKEAREAAKKFEHIKEATEKSIGALNQFANATQQAAEIFEKQNSTVTEMLQATRNVEKELTKLPAKYQKQLSGVINPKIIQGMVKVFQEQEREKADNAKRRNTGAQTIRDYRNSGAAEFAASPIQSIFNLIAGNDAMGRSEADMEVGRQKIHQVGMDFAQTSIGRIGQEEFTGRNFSQGLKELSSIDDSDVTGRVNKAVDLLGLDREKDAEAVATLTNIFQEGGRVAEQFLEGLSKNTLEMQTALRVREKMRPEMEAFAKANRDAAKKVNFMRKTLESEQRARKAVMQITSKAAKAFLTEVGSIKLDNINKLAEMQSDANQKFGGSVTETQTALSQTDGMLGAGLERSVSAFVEKAAKGGIGSVTQKEAEQQAQKIQARIDELRDGEGKSDSQAAEDKAQADMLEGTKIAVENLGGTSERMKEELKFQSEELKKQTKAQIEAAKQAQRLRSFGGTQALLDPSKLNSQYTQIRASGAAEVAARQAGSSVGVSRARINRFSAIQDLAGGELPEHMRGRARKEAYSVALNDTRLQNRALGLGMSEKDIRSTASEKASALFKGNPQEENTKQLKSLNDTLKAGIKLKDESLQGQIRINKEQQDYARKRSREGSRLRSRSREYREAMEAATGSDLEEIEARAAASEAGTSVNEQGDNRAAGTMIGGAVGTAAGMYAGAKFGAIGGSFAGPIGTLVGGALGAVVGAGIGFVAGGYVGGSSDEEEVNRAGERAREASGGAAATSEEKIKQLDSEQRPITYSVTRTDQSTKNININVEAMASSWSANESSSEYPEGTGKAMMEGGEALVTQGKRIARLENWAGKDLNDQPPV